MQKLAVWNQLIQEQARKVEIKKSRRALLSSSFLLGGRFSYIWRLVLLGLLSDF